MPTLPNQVDLLVDTDSRRLVKSFTSTKADSPPVFTFGDSVPVTVRLLRRTSENASSSRPYSEIDLSNLAARVAVGAPGGDPTSGTWQITFDGNTTSNLAYNASASNFQAELNKLTTIQNAGNVAVTKPGTGLYRVAFNSVGARNVFTADSTPLYPSSEIQIHEAKTGNASAREVQLVHIETQTAAYVELTTALASAAVTVATTRTGNATTGVSEIQTIDLSSPEPYGGTWTATTNSGSVTNTSAPIAYNATASALQSALIATNSTVFTSKIDVSGAFPKYTVEFDDSLGDVAAITTDATTLEVPTGFKGNLDCNTSGFRELLAGAASAEGTLEVEIRNTTAATSWTPIQTIAIVREDLINGSPAVQGAIAKDYVDLTSTQTVTGSKHMASMILHGDGSVASFTCTESNAVVQLDNISLAFTALPTSDPGIVGRVWNNSGVMTISAG